MKRVLARGFTLVELLIVIGLLGAIAVIVIAAINPIEQANRARDARFKADSSQLLSAVERYYTSHSRFPWEDVTGSSFTTDDEFPFVSAGNEYVGLCGADCTTQGLLITSDEIKNEFLSRDFIRGVTGHGAFSGTDGDRDKKIYIGKGAFSSASVYACFIPKSKSTRETAIKNKSVRTLSFDGAGAISSTTGCDTGGGSCGRLGSRILHGLCS